MLSYTFYMEILNPCLFKKCAQFIKLMRVLSESKFCSRTSGYLLIENCRENYGLPLRVQIKIKILVPLYNIHIYIYKYRP